MVLPSPLRIEPTAGYSPAVGRLVCMLTYVRATTFAAVEGMTMKELDHLHDSHSNSIGALLAHIAAEERSYQCIGLGFMPLRTRLTIVDRFGGCGSVYRRRCRRTTFSIELTHRRTRRNWRPVRESPLRPPCVCQKSSALSRKWFDINGSC